MHLQFVPEPSALALSDVSRFKACDGYKRSMKQPFMQEPSGITIVCKSDVNVNDVDLFAMNIHDADAYCTIAHHVYI